MPDEFNLPPMNPKGVDVLNNYSRFLLIDGPRRVGKTIAVADKIIRHAWENDGAVVGIIARTLRNGELGVWGDLVNTGSGRLYAWAKYAGLKISKEPSISATTKMCYFRVRNYYGGESEVQLHSLEHDHEVEQKLKGVKFSLANLVEADNFKDENVFATISQCLRSMVVPRERQQFLLDTNPAQEGKRHWIYKRFIENKIKDHDRIHWTIDDNAFLTAEEKQEIHDTYANDQNKLARYYYGEWVDFVTEGTTFEDVYREETHIVPTLTSERDKMEWELIDPPRESHVFHTGWDIGNLNTAWVMGVPRSVDGEIAFDIIDEQVWLQETKRGLSNFTEVVLEKMGYWEERRSACHGKAPVLWQHWSDTSSMNQSMTINGTEAMLIEKYSEGKIRLLPVRKGRHSVAARRDLLHRLLFEQRIVVGSNCQRVQSMLEQIRPGTGTNAIDPHSEHKHIFDALTYMLSCAVPSELNKRVPGASKPKPTVMIL
jgi:hypothetical protein